MDNLTAARVDLVRRYLAHPQGWPDGIEWKDGDHWYTKNRAYWDALAANATANKDDKPANKPDPVSNAPEPVSSDPKAARKAYMRELMRKRRAKP